MSRISVETAAALPDRRTRKRERTRHEIYDSAMELFAHQSYESVTIDMICEAADVGRGTFFLHFPAKAALLGEFSRRLAEDFSAGLEHRGEASADEVLIALIREIGRRIEAQRETMLAMMREFLHTPEAIVHSNEKERALPDLIENLVRRGQKEGQFSSRIHPRLATASILSTASAILSGWVFEDQQIAPAEVLRQYLEIIFRGLGGEFPKSQRKRRK